MSGAPSCGEPLGGDRTCQRRTRYGHCPSHGPRSWAPPPLVYPPCACGSRIPHTVGWQGCTSAALVPEPPVAARFRKAEHGWWEVLVGDVVVGRARRERAGFDPRWEARLPSGERAHRPGLGIRSRAEAAAVLVAERAQIAE